MQIIFKWLLLGLGQAVQIEKRGLHYPLSSAVEVSDLRLKTSSPSNHWMLSAGSCCRAVWSHIRSRLDCQAVERCTSTVCIARHWGVRMRHAWFWCSNCSQMTRYPAPTAEQVPVLQTPLTCTSWHSQGSQFCLCVAVLFQCPPIVMKML